MHRKLEKRLNYFLRSDYRGRKDVRQTMSLLRSYGRLAIVGGMLRDLTLFGNIEFKSDIDFVIDAENVDEFEKYMATLGARVNRFGGYALPNSRWQIDVWPLKRTWAHVHGYVYIDTLEDLCRSTFFNVDGIVYDLADKKIGVIPGYFDMMKRRELEINLLPNPNPVGNIVRAFRYSLTKGFRWGPGLSQFVFNFISHKGWSSLVNYERRSSNGSYLHVFREDEVLNALADYLSFRRTNFYDPCLYKRFRQLDLPYVRRTTNDREIALD